MTTTLMFILPMLHTMYFGVMAMGLGSMYSQNICNNYSFFLTKIHLFPNLYNSTGADYFDVSSSLVLVRLLYFEIPNVKHMSSCINLRFRRLSTYMSVTCQ